MVMVLTCVDFDGVSEFVKLVNHCHCILYHCDVLQMMARDSSFLSSSFFWFFRVFSFRVVNLQLQMLILWMPRHVPV